MPSPRFEPPTSRSKTQRIRPHGHGEVISTNIFVMHQKHFFSAAATIKLNGLNSLSLKYPVGVTNEADDITIRFRSIEQAGLLITTRHDRSQDKLELSLESARVRVTLQVYCS